MDPTGVEDRPDADPGAGVPLHRVRLAGVGRADRRRRRDRVPAVRVFLYPLSWMQTWGVALLAIGGAVGVVVAAAVLLR
jgi:hypothetical protein